MSTRSFNSEPLYSGERIELTRDGHQMILESTAWSFVTFQLLTIILLLPALFLDAAFWLAFARQGGIGWLFAAVACGFGVFCGFWNLAAWSWPRRFEFDFDTNICRFHNIPGLGLSIPFDEIEAIDVLHQKFAGSVLGLALQGKKRRLRMHMFLATKKNRPEIEEQMVIIAEAMSKLLDRPVRVFEKMTNRHSSWR